ncbi:MAG: hypothetical protein ABR577_16315 [Pyrinomonadaceae bacterium]
MASDNQITEKSTSEALLDRFKLSFNDLLRGYEKEVLLRVLTQLLVPVCGPIDSVLTRKATDSYQDRVLELFESIIRDLSNIEDHAIRREFVYSEEFFELLGTCVDTVARTASQNKRRYVAAFLAGTIKRCRIHDLSQQIAEDLRGLQDFHLHILTLLPQHLTKVTTSTNVLVEVIDIHGLQNNTGLDWGVFNKGICDLERLGFIHQDSVGMTFEEGSMMVYRATKYLNIFSDSLAA